MPVVFMSYCYQSKMPLNTENLSLNSKYLSFNQKNLGVTMDCRHLRDFMMRTIMHYVYAP